MPIRSDSGHAVGMTHRKLDINSFHQYLIIPT